MAVHRAFSKGERELEKRFAERERLIKPFIRRFRNPILVHSTHDRKVFHKILEEGFLKLPSEHGGDIKLPHMAKALQIDDVLFLSLGFMYSTAYDFKYSLIFDIQLLKDLVYYRSSVIYACYRGIVDYWYEHDRTYLEKLANTNSECRAVIDKYYYEPYRGKVLVQFDFWRIEETLFNAIQEHPKKQVLLTIARKTAKQLISKYPNSRRHARHCYTTDKVPEIISRNAIDLTTHPCFLGVYIKGDIDQKSRALLKKRYSSKILFDGKQIKSIAHW